MLFCDMQSRRFIMVGAARTSLEIQHRSKDAEESLDSMISGNPPLLWFTKEKEFGKFKLTEKEEDNYG